MRVLVFGASSTQGYWDSQGGWADRLKHYYDNLQMQDFSVDRPKVMNLGISGDKAESVLNRLESEAEARQNAKGISFVIQIGSNNAADTNGQTRSTPEKYKDELAQIIKQAQQFSEKVLVVGFPAVDEARTNPVMWDSTLSFKNANIVTVENAAAEVCSNLSTSFVPVYAEFEKSDKNLHSHDGLHPNDAGHQLIFELVKPELDKLLAA